MVNGKGRAPVELWLRLSTQSKGQLGNETLDPKKEEGLMPV